MQEQIIAAIAGAATSALRLKGRGVFSIFQVFITGFMFAYFVAGDVTMFINEYLGIIVGYAGVYFVLAYLGAEILDRAITVIRVFQVGKKWS